MKNLLLGLVLLLGVVSAVPADAQPQLRASPATVGARGFGHPFGNNWYYCPAGSTPLYLNGGWNVVNRYVWPYGYTSAWVYVSYPGVYCVY